MNPIAFFLLTLMLRKRGFYTLSLPMLFTGGAHSTEGPGRAGVGGHRLARELDRHGFPFILPGTGQRAERRRRAGRRRRRRGRPDRPGGGRAAGLAAGGRRVLLLEGGGEPGGRARTTEHQGFHPLGPRAPCTAPRPAAGAGPCCASRAGRPHSAGAGPAGRGAAPRGTRRPGPACAHRLSAP
ncbi:hypothetical protein [Streptomyces sp. KL116D]|uniref:hypothetical protein n=1 Tax=Streptomyces sp. KL116D TaxID=3045152 RepID=UPI0035588E5C